MNGVLIRVRIYMNQLRVTYLADYPDFIQTCASWAENLADLQKRSANITAQINENLIKVNKEMKASNANQLVEPENSESTNNRELNTEIEPKTEPGITDNTGAETNSTNSDVTQSELKK